MEEVVIYEKSTCSKCRIALAILDEHGVPYRAVRYHDTPLSAAKLAELTRKLGIAPKDLVRKEDPQYRALKVDVETLDAAEAIRLMIKHPDLIQRPILERSDSAIIGRPPERIMEFLKD